MRRGRPVVTWPRPCHGPCSSNLTPGGSSLVSHKPQAHLLPCPVWAWLLAQEMPPNHPLRGDRKRQGQGGGGGWPWGCFGCCSSDSTSPGSPPLPPAVPACRWASASCSLSRAASGGGHPRQHSRSVQQPEPGGVSGGGQSAPIWALGPRPGWRSEQALTEAGAWVPPPRSRAAGSAGTVRHSTFV